MADTFLHYNVAFAFAQYRWPLKAKIEGRTKTKKDLENLQTVAAHVLLISHHTHPWFNLISHTDRLESMVHGKLNHTCIVTVHSKRKRRRKTDVARKWVTSAKQLIRIYIDVFPSHFRFVVSARYLK